MEKQIKPENLYIRRNRLLTAIGAGICFIIAAALVVAYAVAAVKFPPDDYTLFVCLCVCDGLSGFAFLLIAILNFRNLFFPYLLAADEKGIYDYSGYIHAGFIGWEEISGIKGEADGAVRGFGFAFVRVLNIMDGEPPKLLINLKDAKAFKNTLTRKITYLFRSCITVPTLCAQCKNSELAALLKERLAYYGSQVNNGQ